MSAAWAVGTVRAEHIGGLRASRPAEVGCCGVMAGSSGIVTFLFTDIEGSTRLWQADEIAMRSALSRHDQLLRKVTADHEGRVFSAMGDGMAAAFGSASAAVQAAMAAQRSLQAEPCPTATPLRVRMGVNTGETEWRGRGTTSGRW
jgi:class 3 adenylate cyclase